MSFSTQENIDDFLAHKRLAIVGLSRDSKEFSRYIYKELRERGYDVVPVNPNMTELDGKPCFASLHEVQPPVEGVLVMTPAAQSESVVRDGAEAGITRYWLVRGTGEGAVSKEALDFCHEHNLRVVPGFCPYMFLPGSAAFHRFHAFFAKRSAAYRH